MSCFLNFRSVVGVRVLLLLFAFSLFGCGGEPKPTATPSPIPLPEIHKSLTTSCQVLWGSYGAQWEDAKCQYSIALTHYLLAPENELEVEWLVRIQTYLDSIPFPNEMAEVKPPTTVFQQIGTLRGLVQDQFNGDWSDFLLLPNEPGSSISLSNGRMVVPDNRRRWVEIRTSSMVLTFVCANGFSADTHSMGAKFQTCLFRELVSTSADPTQPSIRYTSLGELTLVDTNSVNR